MATPISPVRKILLSAFGGAMDASAARFGEMPNGEQLSELFFKLGAAFKLATGNSQALDEPLAIDGETNMLICIKNDGAWISFSGGNNKIELNYPAELPIPKATVTPIKGD